MPHAPNQPASTPLSNISMSKMPATPEAVDALLVNLIQQFSAALAEWRGSRLTGITLDMEPLQ